MPEPTQVETDVLVIGAGGAGMYAAIEAARAGCRVLLIDRSLIGRGGATVMAQMTVAVALGAETPDHWTPSSRRYARAGRGLCSEPLARLLCEEGPDCIREMEHGASAGRARTATSRRPWRPAMTGRAASMSISSTPAPPCRRRCARWSASARRHPQGGRPVSSTCQGRTARWPARSRWHRRHRRAGVIAAKATIVATGGLTRLYRRNSASANMGGDGYALALRAGAPLVDMEFVQFFPIGILRRGSSAWTRSCGIRSATSSAGGCSTAIWRSSPTATAAGGRQIRAHARRGDLRDRQGGGGRARLAARRRVSELPARCSGRSSAKHSGR